MKTLSLHPCFGGTLGYYSHKSHANNCTMRFTVFMPPKPTGAGLIYLSGLTCTEDNFTVKAGAYRVAAELGLILVAPDTSPRGDNVPDDESIGLGKGAGFYVDATEAPWNTHYTMYSYITEELPPLVAETFGIKTFGLFGHSMGGHGALVIGLRNPQLFRSLSAFAPICNPSLHGWGPVAFTAYLGADKAAWKQYDATLLVQDSGFKVALPEILIDQGLADAPYQEGKLTPEIFVKACETIGQPIRCRFHENYDHGYFFIQTFIEDHLRHHATLLQAL